MPMARHDLVDLRWLTNQFTTRRARSGKQSPQRSPEMRRKTYLIVLGAVAAASLLGALTVLLIGGGRTGSDRPDLATLSGPERRTALARLVALDRAAVIERWNAAVAKGQAPALTLDDAMVDPLIMLGYARQCGVRAAAQTPIVESPLASMAIETGQARAKANPSLCGALADPAARPPRPGAAP